VVLEGGRCVMMCVDDTYAVFRVVLVGVDVDDRVGGRDRVRMCSCGCRV
jgi:hypothetical protein